MEVSLGEDLSRRLLCTSLPLSYRSGIVHAVCRSREALRAPPAAVVREGAQHPMSNPEHSVKRMSQPY